MAIATGHRVIGWQNLLRSCAGRSRRAEPHRIGPTLPTGAGLGYWLDIVPAITARPEQQESIHSWLDRDAIGACAAMAEASAETRLPSSARIEDPAEVADRHEVAVRGNVLTADHSPRQQAC